MSGRDGLGGGDQTLAGCAPCRKAASGMSTNFLLQAKPIRIVGNREIGLEHHVLGNITPAAEDRAPWPSGHSHTLPSIGGASIALAAALPRADTVNLDSAGILGAWIRAA